MEYCTQFFLASVGSGFVWLDPNKIFGCKSRSHETNNGFDKNQKIIWYFCIIGVCRAIKNHIPSPRVVQSLGMCVWSSQTDTRFLVSWLFGYYYVQQTTIAEGTDNLPWRSHQDDSVQLSNMPIIIIASTTQSDTQSIPQPPLGSTERPLRLCIVDAYIQNCPNPTILKL